MTEYLPVKPYLQCNLFQATNLDFEHWVCLTLLGFVLPPVLIVSQCVRLYANDYKVFVSVRDTPWTSCWMLLHFLHKCSSSNKQASLWDNGNAGSAVPGTAQPHLSVWTQGSEEHMWNALGQELTLCALGRKRDMPLPYFLSTRVMVQGGLSQTRECKNNGTYFSLPTQSTKCSCCLELLSSLESCFVKYFLRQGIIQVCFVSWLAVGSAGFLFQG